MNRKKTNRIGVSLFRLLIIFGALLLLRNPMLGQQKATLAFNVSIEQSHPQKFHIVLNCEGMKGEIQDFKIPVFAPGYYRIMDFAANVENFSVEDKIGTPLPWEKINKNTWRVCIGGISSVKLRYRVKSRHDSVADSFIDDKRAYISSPGIFMYPDGQINSQVTVTLIPPPKFSKISTGLEPVPGKTHSFYARNFDILYDCPIYMGNQEIISFIIRGIPHYVAMESPGTFNRQDLTADLKKMIQTATGIIGDIPYRHYSYIFMGEGKGGLEHRNSSALFIDVSGNQNPWKEKRFMKFLTHEYFHLYNVKRIRPVALGPFDYDRGNSTDMLWFSEGGTVYYEFIILNRAGFFNRNQCLEYFSDIICRNENNPAHLTQSVGEASRKAWTQSFFGNDKETSYYDKGFILSLLLDLKIRHETKNKKSLDDVMRACYYEFYKKRQRGFTNREFRQICEKIAGVSLSEFFAYINSTKEIQYGKYLDYAGLAFKTPVNTNAKNNFQIVPIPNPSPLQSAILKSWLKD